jgi:hypothetical protein
MRTRQWLFNAFTAAILVALGACGGGGDGGPPPVTGPTIDITAANRDTVAHATVAGVVGLSPTGMIPVATASSGSGRLMSAWLQSLSRQVASAWAWREHPQTVYGPYTYQCAVSGTSWETDDDRDGNGVPSAGDVVTMGFNSCQDTAGETTSGTMTMTLTSANATSGSARVVMTQLLYDTPKHAMTLDGTMLVTYTSGSVETAQATAEGAVTVAASIKHLTPPFNDTVTLQNGFAATDTHDATQGLTTSTFSGLVQSAAAGGVVQVNTVAGTPIRKLDTDANPSAGAMQVKGKNSELLMTVQSNTAVRLDHDVNGDGAFESTEVKDWDWLL